MDEKTFQTTILMMLRCLYIAANHGQYVPDSRPCSICGDTKHLASKCPENTFKILDKEQNR